MRPVYGGRHPGAGTQNALLSLGPRSYMEILAPHTDVELPEEVASPPLTVAHRSSNKSRNTAVMALAPTRIAPSSAT